MPSPWFDAFERRDFALTQATLHARVPREAPDGRPALLLLHGFPQTHAMWGESCPMLRATSVLPLAPALSREGQISRHQQQVGHPAEPTDPGIKQLKGHPVGKKQTQVDAQGDSRKGQGHIQQHPASMR